MLCSYETYQTLAMLKFALVRLTKQSHQTLTR